MRRTLTIRSCCPRRPDPASRHWRFVARLLCGRRAARIGEVPRTLRRTQLAAPSYHNTFILHAAVRRFMLVSGSLPQLRERIARRLESVLTQREHHRQERTGTRIVQRLDSRFVHHAIVIAASRPATMRPSVQREAANGQFPRLALTLSRPHASGPASQSPAATDAQAHAERAASAPLHSRAAAVASLPAHELSRVTEHVLRTLDRRVLSYRERTGQI